MRRTRNPGAIVVVLLMACSARHGWQSSVGGPALHIHQVHVSVVALCGPIAARVAVHAARALQHGRNALEGGKCLQRRGARSFHILAEDHASRAKGARQDHRRCSPHHGPRHILSSMAMLRFEEIGERSLI
jgi:hypothetical protein